MRAYVRVCTSACVRLFKRARLHVATCACVGERQKEVQAAKDSNFVGATVVLLELL